MSADKEFNLNEDLNLDTDLNLSEVETDNQGGLNSLSNLEVTISAEVGLSKMQLQEAKKMVAGTVIILDKAVGELADLKVNGTHVGKGQIIEKNGRYGIKIISLNNN